MRAEITLEFALAITKRPWLALPLTSGGGEQVTAAVPVVTGFIKSHDHVTRGDGARWKLPAFTARKLPFFLLLILAAESFAGTNLFPEFTLEQGRDYLRAISGTVETQAGTNAELYFLNARLQSELGEKNEAERLARRALECNPNRADIQVFLADVYIRQDRLPDAATALRDALKVAPRDGGAGRRLGMVLDRLGETNAAQEALEAAVRNDPDDAMARLLLGRKLLNQQKLEAAMAQLERACQLDPASVNAHYALFQTQTQLGEQAAAQKTLQIFRELKMREKSEMEVEDIRQDGDKNLRNYTTGYHTAAGAQMLRQGQEMLGEAHLRQALTIAPEQGQAYEILAGFYLSKGRLLEAKPLLTEMVKLRPDDIARRLNLGTVLLQLKDPEGITVLKRLLELDPKHAEALNNLARYYLSTRQDLPEALGLCQRLVEARPSAANYDLLGWAFYATGKTNEAIRASGQAVAMEPANAVYRQRYERLRQLAGRIQE